MIEIVQDYITVENGYEAFLFLMMALALAVFLKDRFARRFLFAKVESVLLESNGQNLSASRLAQNDHRIQRITKTTVAFWNNTGKPISHSDISRDNRLRVELPTGAAILNAEVVGSTDAAATIVVNVYGMRSAAIDFDRLDVGQGFNLVCLHSGEKGALSVRGRLAGIGAPWSVYGRSVAWSAAKLLSYIALSLGAGLLVSDAFTLLVGFTHNGLTAGLVPAISILVMTILAFVLLDGWEMLQSSKRISYFAT